MSRTIDHFIWSYQSHFRVGQECAANRVFRKLDDRFRPHIFLVGIRVEERSDCHPACVEPEDDFWIESSAFDQILREVRSKILAYPESRMIQSHPIAQQRQNERLLRRAVRDLIVQTIEVCESRPRDLSFFASYPVRVDAFLVSTVLGLQTSIIGSHYSLTTDKISLHECRDIPLARSFIEAVIEEFLESTANELQMPEAGCGLSGISTDETLRSAAARLMRDVVWRIDQDRVKGMHGLLEACNTIASLHYERQASSGQIILARNDHPAVSRQITFRTPTDIDKARAARKLLQLAFDDLSLHSDSESVFGLATVNAYDSVNEDLFTVRVLDHHYWELTHAERPLMRVKYGHPSLPHLSLDERRLRSNLRRLFDGITDEHLGNIGKFIKQAERERHGTLIVVTTIADQEAERLCNQATPIVPCLLTPDLLKHLTPIDGAVLLSPDGTCFAAGVILDGMATNDGDPARGARFNSALRYVNSSSVPCMAIIVSEDGGIDFVPDLAPTIQRTSIDTAIAQLRRLLDDPKINRRTFSLMLDWLDEHRFYLLQPDCDALNELVTEIDSRLDEQDPLSVKFHRRPFVASDLMVPAMYYE